MDSNVQMYNARLVVKGYRQRQEVDFDETFSPIAMLKSIRVFLVIAAHTMIIRFGKWMSKLYF